MLCERCGQNPATVHLTNISGGTVSEHHLCEKCAGDEKFISELKNFDIFEMLSQKKQQEQSDSKVLCPVCGTYLSEFKKTAIAGCSNCYKIFAPVIKTMLIQIHGADEHIKDNLTEMPSPQSAVQALKAKLKKAVEAEEYEKAAILRDEIKKLSEEDIK